MKRRLPLVRQLHVHAVHLATGPTTLLRRITSVITFDLAVENALRVTISALDPSFKIDTDVPHPKLVQHASDLVQKAVASSLPAKSGIGYLHHTRNDAQHNGRYPSSDEIAECRAHASSFLTELCTLVWDLDFNAISLTALLNDVDVKALLDEAESALRTDDFAQAVTKAAAALSWLVSQAIQALFPRSKTRLWKGIGPVHWNIGLATPPKPRIDQETAKELARIDKDIVDKTRALENEVKGLREQVKDEFDAFEEPLLCSLLGINYSDYVRFRQIAGTQHFNAGPRDFVVRGMKEAPSHDEADFVCAFCLEAAIQVEASVALRQDS